MAAREDTMAKEIRTEDPEEPHKPKDKEAEMEKKKISCDQCNFSSNYQYNLFRHIIKAHGQNIKRKQIDDPVLTPPQKKPKTADQNTFHCNSYQYRCKKNFSLKRHTLRRH